MTRHAAEDVGGHRPEPDQSPGEEVVLPARTILVAAGTQPNTVLAREDPEHVALDGRYFRALDEAGNPATPERVAKPEAVRVLMSLLEDGRTVAVHRPGSVVTVLRENESLDGVDVVPGFHCPVAAAFQ